MVQKEFNEWKKPVHDEPAFFYGTNFNLLVAEFPIA